MFYYYRFIVYLHGKYLFATEPLTLFTPEECEKVTKIMNDKFPRSEGYKVITNCWKSRLL